MNSSTLRELVVAVLSGYEPSLEKLGYNGFRQNALTGKTECCEIKPRNIRTDTTAKTPAKLSGDGNFTDYTWKKFKRHKEENPNMLVAGFIDGRLIYIFQFSFNEQSFTSRLQAQLERHFPKGDISGQYLRSAQFTLNHYIDAKTMEMIYTVSMEELIREQSRMRRNLFTYLKQHHKDG
ncbi:MAG: hypothetical protein OXB93_04590 [Cytophagales bacterium]|nr:hypothetical protein [Cytophagales bacterium]